MHRNEAFSSSFTYMSIYAQGMSPSLGLDFDLKPYLRQNPAISYNPTTAKNCSPSQPSHQLPAQCTCDWGQLPTSHRRSKPR